MDRYGAEGRLARAFGTNDEGLPNLPRRISGVAVARLIHTDDRGGCSFCFPHGSETTNSKFKTNRRSWKNHRKTQYKV